MWLCAVNFCGAGSAAKKPGDVDLGIRVGLGKLVFGDRTKPVVSLRDTRCALSLAGRIASGLAHPIKSRHSRARGEPCGVFGLAKSFAPPRLSRRQPAVGNTDGVAWTWRRLYWPFMATESGVELTTEDTEDTEGYAE